MMVAKAVRGQEGMVAMVTAKAGWSLWLWWWCGHSQDDLRTMAMLQMQPAQDEVAAMVSPSDGMVTMGVAWPMPR